MSLEELVTVSVLVSDTVVYSFLVIRYAYTFLVTKICSPCCPPVAIRIRFFVFTQFSMPNVSHMDAYRIYDLTVVHLFRCYLNSGPALP